MNNFVNKHIKWVFSLPALIFMMVMIAVPIAMTFLFSLSDWNLLTGNGMLFNWGKNYLDVLASREFWQSLGITFYYTAIATVAEMLLGLAIALVLNKDFWGKNGVKAVVLLPYMMAPVAVGLMWMLFYEPSSGLLNYIFTTVGLPRSAFVSAKQTVIPAIAAVETWQMSPMVPHGGCQGGRGDTHPDILPGNPAPSHPDPVLHRSAAVHRRIQVL